MAKLSPAYESKKMNVLMRRGVQTDGRDCNKTCFKKINEIRALNPLNKSIVFACSYGLSAPQS